MISVTLYGRRSTRAIKIPCHFGFLRYFAEAVIQDRHVLLQSFEIIRVSVSLCYSLSLHVCLARYPVSYTSSVVSKAGNASWPTRASAAPAPRSSTTGDLRCEVEPSFRLPRPCRPAYIPKNGMKRWPAHGFELLATALLNEGL